MIWFYEEIGLPSGLAFLSVRWIMNHLVSVALALLTVSSAEAFESFNILLVEAKRDSISPEVAERVSDDDYVIHASVALSEGQVDAVDIDLAKDAKPIGTSKGVFLPGCKLIFEITRDQMNELSVGVEAIVGGLIELHGLEYLKKRFDPFHSVVQRRGGKSNSLVIPKCFVVLEKSGLILLYREPHFYYDEVEGEFSVSAYPGRNSIWFPVGVPVNLGLRADSEGREPTSRRSEPR